MANAARDDAPAVVDHDGARAELVNVAPEIARRRTAAHQEGEEKGSHAATLPPFRPPVEPCSVAPVTKDKDQSKGQPVARRAPSRAPAVEASAQPSNDLPPVVPLHPIFGPLAVKTIWVYRIFRRANGDRFTRDQARNVPAEKITDEAQVYATWGAGSYRLTPRNEVGQLAGPSREVEFLDETGKVPMVPPEELDSSTPTPGGAAPAAPGSIAAPAQEETVVKLLREEIGRLDRRMTSELGVAEQRRVADLGSLGGIMDKVLEVAKASASAGGGAHASADNVVIQLLRDRISNLETENRDLRERNYKLADEGMRARFKAEHGDSSFEKAAAEALGPTLQQLGPAAGMALLARFTGGKGLPQGAAGGSGAGETVARLMNVKFPSVEELRAHIEGNNAIPGEILAAARQLREVGALPDQHWKLLEPYINLAVAAATP